MTIRRTGSGRASRGPVPSRHTPISALPLIRPRVLRPAGLPARAGRWFAADIHAALAVALSIPVLVGEALHGFAGSGTVLAVTVLYVLLQVVLAAVPGGSGRGARDVMRFALAVPFVGALTLLEPRTAATLPILYVPVVALASAVSARGGVVIATLAVASFFLTLAVQLGPGSIPDQGLIPAVVVAFLVLGTRRVVDSLERSLVRLRRTVSADRRRARRMAALEELGRILATEGTSRAGLEATVDTILHSFGYRYPSVYLLDGDVLRLGAHRGYVDPLVEMPLERGVMGRVARTGQPAFLPDVTLDPDYAAGDPAVTSEISLPLLAGTELLGVLNVESGAIRPLDQDDFAVLRMVADRLALALELGRERQKLTERTGLLDRLIGSAATLSGSLDRGTVAALVVESAVTVVRCDAAILTLAAESGAEYRIVAVQGAPASLVGRTIEPGEGAAGRAIAERRVIIDDDFGRAKFPRLGLDAIPDVTVRVMAIPMERDEMTLGAISFVRGATGRGFSDQEREVGQLIAVQAALALANAALHEDALEAAVRDPLTGLHNRRFLDGTLARMRAAWARTPEGSRRPVAAILFDLDHFGDLNNRHGHTVGDAVLRAFAGLLAARFRASDLVARYGGEEFLVVLDGASRDDALRAAEGIRAAFEAVAVPIPGGVVRSTVSAGCAGVEPTGAGLERLIEVADVGLAMAKSGGRNQVVAA